MRLQGEFNFWTYLFTSTYYISTLGQGEVESVRAV